MKGYELILAAAAVITAGGVLVRFLHLPELLRGTRLFLVDWNGEPARPGVPARPSFPERMATVEDRTAATEKRTADLNHNMRGEITSRLALLAEGQERLHASGDRNAEAIHRLDGRVTDHRKRNDEQIAHLRDEVERRLSSISGDLLRAEVYRASLVELGIEIDPPRRNPPEGTR